MTDPKQDVQDVRAQFEAAMRELWGDAFRPERHPGAIFAYEYLNANENCAWLAYQAALQSPAVRELVEESERVAHHLECAVEYIEKVYPNAKQLDRGPILNNMRRWSGKLRTALRTLGAGHEG